MAKTMSKAEDRYLEHFQDGRVRNCSSKEAFLLGYHQAEKDFELTWEDMRELYVIFAEVDAEIELCKADNIKSETIGYYQEVLKRFKDLKNEYFNYITQTSDRKDYIWREKV